MVECPTLESINNRFTSQDRI